MIPALGPAAHASKTESRRAGTARWAVAGPVLIRNRIAELFTSDGDVRILVAHGMSNDRPGRIGGVRLVTGFPCHVAKSNGASLHASARPATRRAHVVSSGSRAPDVPFGAYLSAPRWPLSGRPRTAPGMLVVRGAGAGCAGGRIRCLLGRPERASSRCRPGRRRRVWRRERAAAPARRPGRGRWR